MQSMFNFENNSQQHYQLKPTDTFTTNTNGVLKAFVVTEQGDPLNRFIYEKEISTFKKLECGFNYNVNKQEILQARIVSIENDKVVVQIDLGDFETSKELNPFYVKKLKMLGLLYVDSEFEFVITETETGQLTEVRAFEKFEDEEEVIDFYKKLKNEIGN